MLPTSTRRQDLKEVIAVFLKMGFTAFGGPAAHIAMFHDEVVVRRKWLDDQGFLDLLGATNLIPGPNSTEMAIHISFLRAGWAGLVLGGACFILPAMLIVMALAWVYVQFGSTPQVEWLLYGIKPVVIVIILQALWVLGRKATKGALTALVGLGALGLYFIQVSPLVVLLVGGMIVMALKNIKLLNKPNIRSWFIYFSGLGIPLLTAIPFSYWLLVLDFFQDWRCVVWQWLCTSCIPAGRFHQQTGLADQSTAPGRHRHRSGYPWTSVYHSYLYRLPAWWRARGHPGDNWDLLTIFYFSSPQQLVDPTHT